MASSPSGPTHGAGRMGVPRTRAEYIRTCGHLRKLVERRGWATAVEIESVWPPRGKAAAEWEWVYCWQQLSQFLTRGDAAAYRQSDERERIVAQIVAREPVYTQVGGRTVGVTSRGLFAMIRLARHDMARREITDTLQDVADAVAEVQERRHSGELTRTAARRRTKRLRRIYERLHDQLCEHTAAVLANALTPDGADVAPEDAPAWLDEHAPWARRATAAELAGILLALFMAGPKRMEALGPAPESGRKRDRSWNEDFGFWSLLSYFAREHGVRPPDIHDLTQLLTMSRAGAPYIPPPDEPRGKMPASGVVH